MNLGRFGLTAQISVGCDGASYRASSLTDESRAEVRILSAARSDPDRWKPLVKRLRLAAMIDHPAVDRILELNLEQDPPFVALQFSEGESLSRRLRDSGTLPGQLALSLIGELAELLTITHRLGLVHGGLCPSSVRVTSSDRPKVDLTGIDAAGARAGGAPIDLDPACCPPERKENAQVDPAGDVYALGALLACMLVENAPKNVADLQNSLADQFRTLIPHEALSPDRMTGFAKLVQAMLAVEPTERPSAKVVAECLATLRRVMDATNVMENRRDDPSGGSTQTKGQMAETGTLVATGDFSSGPAEVEPKLPLPSLISARERLGRFRLLGKLGAGGMGEVYRGEDLSDGTVVAIKVLGAELVNHPEALRRFHKEARLLAEANNPFVANLLEVNEDDGIHYLVMEFVAGKTVDSLLRECGRLDEPLALRIMGDVVRALAIAHERGIVHRDVKPGNILLERVGGSGLGVRLPIVDGSKPAAQAKERASAPSLALQALTLNPQPLTPQPRVKLTDFGLARHVVESESLNVTRTGAILGTPLYMSPEQCSGREAVDARSDVYSCGATLFHLLAGRPPFLADSPLNLISMHCNDPPPGLEKFNPAVSPGVCQIVQKTLAKNPDERYANASELLADLERIERGEPTSITVHPKIPECDPSKLMEFKWVWDLEASPNLLWPHVSNTERLNRAVGLQAPKFTLEAEPAGPVRRFAKVRSAGMDIVWEEHPFEWIEGRRFGVLREFSKGPFKWYTSVVELRPRISGGTTLTHCLKIEPSGLLGRTVAAVEVGIRSKRSLDRVYRRIDAAVTGRLGSKASVDPFEPPAELSTARRQKLDGRLDKLTRHGIDPSVVEQLGDFLAQAPDQEIARIRPLELARRMALPSEQVVNACLHGAREGLLVMLWDILCPICRIPSEVKDTLRVMSEHGRCEACNLDFELDFANSVELIFRAHPEIRDVELGTYCIGGPVHFPHIVAQARVAPGERMEMGLALTDGPYRLRGPQLPFSFDFRVERSAPIGRLDLNLAHAPDPAIPRALKSGSQVLVLTNTCEAELLARVERTASRDDALTAARASSLALFRALFPGEILSPGQLISVTTVTLLVTDVEQASSLYQELGDAGAFKILHEHFRLLGDRIGREGGAVIKTVGEGLVAAFSDPVAGVRAALYLQSDLDSSSITRNLKIRVGIHRGPAMVATVNDHLDYFGTTANTALQLPQFAGSGELVMTETVAGDQAVATFLGSRSADIQVFELDWGGSSPKFGHRIQLPGRCG